MHEWMATTWFGCCKYLLLLFCTLLDFCTYSNYMTLYFFLHLITEAFLHCFNCYYVLNVIPLSSPSASFAAVAPTVPLEDQ